MNTVVHVNLFCILYKTIRQKLPYSYYYTELMKNMASLGIILASKEILQMKNVRHLLTR